MIRDGQLRRVHYPFDVRFMNGQFMAVMKLIPRGEMVFVLESDTHTTFSLWVSILTRFGIGYVSRGDLKRATDEEATC